MCKATSFNSAIFFTEPKGPLNSPVSIGEILTFLSVRSGLTCSSGLGTLVNAEKYFSSFS